MKAIAKQGDHRYLLVEGVVRPFDKMVGVEQGRVLDLNTHKLYPPMRVASIVARGYWEAATLPPTVLQEMLNRVENVSA